MHVTQNLPNLEKRPPFLQFLSKLSEFFFGERSCKSSSFSFCSLAFESIFFWLGCDDWKMDDLFQRPLGPTSSILNFPKKFLVKAEIQQLSPKKNLRSFDENWGHTCLIRIQRALLLMGRATTWTVFFISAQTCQERINCTKGKEYLGAYFPNIYTVKCLRKRK